MLLFYLWEAQPAIFGNKTPRHFFQGPLRWGGSKEVTCEASPALALEAAVRVDAGGVIGAIVGAPHALVDVDIAGTAFQAGTREAAYDRAGAALRRAGGLVCIGVACPHDRPVLGCQKSSFLQSPSLLASTPNHHHHYHHQIHHLANGHSHRTGVPITRNSVDKNVVT